MSKITLVTSVVKASLSGALKEIWTFYLVFLYAAIAGLGFCFGGLAAYLLLLRITGLQ